MSIQELGALGEFVAAIAVFLSQSRTKTWGNTIGRYAFDKNFVSEVDSFLGNTKPSSYLSDIRKWDDQ